MSISRSDGSGLFVYLCLFSFFSSDFWVLHLTDSEGLYILIGDLIGFNILDTLTTYFILISL